MPSPTSTPEPAAGPGPARTAVGRSATRGPRRTDRIAHGTTASAGPSLSAEPSPARRAGRSGRFQAVA